MRMLGKYCKIQKMYITEKNSKLLKRNMNKAYNIF